ncbi:PfkB family carbohydrate kinase [Streptomyces griseus]|uniref:PfkB family carbohydrate kinase n=1 Tax=Streptomyces griseus TaxID=1911 RepID=UPI0005670842|nr:PfkB family carbohydrate kinase [Streptomyces griseus]
MAESVRSFDLITMGHTGVDLCPHQSGLPLTRVATSGKIFDGSATNVAVAAARLGRTTTVLTCADHTEELDFFAIRAARVLWITGTGLSQEPGRSTTLAALKSRDGAGMTVFDLDWRPALWRDAEEARPYYAEALRHSTVAVGDLEACEVATGVRGSRACAEELLAAGVELAVVRQGSAGVLSVHRDGTVAQAPPVTSEAVNGRGADDAFGGWLVHGLLSGWELERTLRHANAAGALVTSRPADSCAMPTQAEVEDLLARG